MPLSLKQVQDKCLSGQGSSQCRYLGFHEDTLDCFCFKKVAHTKQQIDLEVAKYESSQKSQGLDPGAFGLAIGDNCAGYLFLTHTEQGYDVDKKITS